ncbi:MAG: substrate-binding domain-containing protein [Gammaproteobacteria bacterium]|nr:substrate-binding domain-containing protein [Gammaproteobacteria bacterium]
MRLTDRLATVALCALFVAVVEAVGLPDRRHILVVGSSTTYPIIAAAAERIARDHGMLTPVIESTGTGGGIKLFCGGQGLDMPDIAMASRPMKDSERDACKRNKVFDVREIRIGYDGIVLASGKHAPPFHLSQHNLYLALAREVPAADDANRLIANPYRNWRDIDPALPDLPIRILGPPPTSGTRDMLVERVLQPICATVPVLQSIRDAAPEQFTERCHALREDGAFVDSGENDARLVRKLLTDGDALAILGYNFLDRNPDRLRAATIDGIAPTFDSIESGEYPLTRPLYLYVKPQHRRLVGGLDLFISRLVSADISGPDGFLADRGLIPLSAAERAASGDP